MNYTSLEAKTAVAKTSDVLGPNENPFSTNKVTGHSINYPIVPTCSPTKVCVKTCYFGCGPSTWPASLAKQWRLYNGTVADPFEMAQRIAKWAKRMKLSFVRWNGGGDLFAESVECINEAATLMPDVPQWVVTRLGNFATQVKPAQNVFVHFSVDRHSWSRIAAMEGYAGNWFWSYQCDAGEKPAKSLAPVVFYDRYNPGSEPLNSDDCPLNATTDITGVCCRCRRCFDGSAVARGKALSAAWIEQVRGVVE